VCEQANIAEVHSAQREIFGLPRVKELIAQPGGGPELVPYLLEHWAAFTGPEWEQEDDMTTIMLQCVSPVGRGILTRGRSG
jgi:hypothetical protein